jgi:large subunit ribosomal protein L10
MDNPRPEKVAVVDEVRERLTSSSAVLLTEYRGLKVSELANLRRTLRDAGGDYKIYKNTLVRFAVRDLGLEGVEELLVGPTAVAFVDGDVAAVAKALRDFSRTNPNLIVKGGVLGQKALSADEAKALAELPSREVLLARLAGGLAAPMVQFAGLLQALPRNMAYGLKALIDQKVAGGEAAPAPAAEEAPAAEAADEAPAADDTTDAEAPAAADEAPAAEAAEADTPETEAPEAETAEEA